MSSLTKKEEQEARALEAQIARLEKLEAEKAAAEERLQEMLDKRVTAYKEKIARLSKLIDSKRAIIERLNNEIAEYIAQIDDLEALIVEITGDNPTLEGEDN